MRTSPYRDAAEVDPDYFVPEPKPKRESPLVRLGLLLAGLLGPAASIGLLTLVVHREATLVVVGSILWALVAWLVLLIAGDEIVQGPGKWGARIRLLGLAWAPLFLPGLIAWNAGRWVLRGDKE